MSKPLAVAALQSLDREVLKPLIQAIKDTDEAPALLQDHYSISGSLEGYMTMVKNAYDVWRRALEYSNDLRYSYILGVFNDHLVAYGYDDNDDYFYAKVAYTIGAGGVTFGDVTPVDVNLVVSSLGIGSMQSADALNLDTASDETQTQSETETLETPLAQDDTTVDAGIMTDAPVVELEAETEEDAGSLDSLIAEQSAQATETDAPVVDAEASTGEAVQTAAPVFDSEKFLAQSAFGDKTKVLQGTGYDFENKLVCKITQSESTEVGGKKHLKIQGIATRGNIVNANGFVYPTSVWQSNLEYMNAEAAAGKFVGKLEHPDAELGLQDVAILFHSFILQGDDLHFEGIVVPTKPYGENLQIMIEAGVQVDLSSRGFGSVITQSWEGVNRPVIQNDFICTAFDAVWHGASFGSGITSAAYQSKTLITSDDVIEGKQEQATTVENTPTTETAPVATETPKPVEQSATPAQDEARRLRAAAELSSYRTDLVAQSALSPIGKAALQNAIAKCDTVDAVFQAKEAIMPVLTASFPVETVTQSAAPAADASSTYAPRFFVKQTAEELAPKNVGEMFDRLVADLPDSYPGMQSNANIPNHFASPRAACKTVMTNIAREVQGAFNGRAAARALLAMEQGRLETAEDILTQSFSADSTIANGNVENDGAPLSAPLIFPLVRRVYPMYILNRIAAIQPMDRPTGKIFYIDNLRTADPTEGSEKRIDLNTSANPFNPTYADNNVEGSKAKLLRMRLNSVLVQCQTKKLGAQWSIEEMQDLRAYHGLDASVELMSAVAREMAQEINLEVLNDMAAQATGGARTFGTGLPATGFTEQKDWDEYIWVYLNALSNDIYGKRNAPATHLVVGMDAALALSKSMRGVFTSGNTSDGSGSMEMYPGTTFYGSINTPTGEKFEVFKTNYWSQGTPNGNKIMAIRKGSDWSDTPYIYAPYTDYMTPQFTDPEDFSQKQGIMNRSARKVVVSDNIALLTVNGSQGVAL